MQTNGTATESVAPLPVASALTVTTKQPQSITRATALLEPANMSELQQLGTLMAQSGFFADARQAAQACVKILAGREMGFPPIASMVGISIIEGKPAAGANLLAAAMKRAGYTWRVLQRDTKGCKLIVSFKGQEVGPSEFTEDDARRAGLLEKRNWKQYPRSMYFARSISDAARTYAPEALAGLPAYTAEELGAEETTEDGALITAPEPEYGTRAAQVAVAERRIAELQAQEPQPGPPPKQWPPAGSAWTTRGEMKAIFSQLRETVGETKYAEEMERAGVHDASEFRYLNAARECYSRLVAIAQQEVA